VQPKAELQKKNNDDYKCGRTAGMVLGGGGVSIPSIEPKQNKMASSIVKWTEITRKMVGRQ
jgi:hypothetical protein